MRTFMTTTTAYALRALEHGFEDIDILFELQGIWLASQPIYGNEGFAEEVTLCLEIPESIFEQFELESCFAPYREALIPAKTLNDIGNPQIYDCQFAGMSRVDLVRAARRAERREAKGYPTSDDFKATIRFFDEIGWLTPLRMREDKVS